MVTNRGVTVEVFQKLTTRQKRMVSNNSNKDMVLLSKWSNISTHKQTLGWKKVKIIIPNKLPIK